MRRSQQREEAAQLAAERRRREDEAPRLQAEVPQLVSLSLAIEERRANSAIAGRAHIRRIIVERAPSLFVMPCSDPDCTSSAHDLTPAIMRALLRAATRFEGESACQGCSSTLRYVGSATYR